MRCDRLRGSPLAVLLVGLVSLTLFAARPAWSVSYYQVPIPYDLDDFSYDKNPGDWNAVPNDSGLSADQIPGNKGDQTNGPPVTYTATIPWRSLTDIPITIGPTTDGFNNVMVSIGQTLPLVPGKYSGIVIVYSQPGGMETVPLTFNYSDGPVVTLQSFADWCYPVQVQGDDLPAWPSTHRNQATAAQNISCGASMKYVPLDSARTLQSITLPADPVMKVPGDDNKDNKTPLILAITLVSDTSGLGGYGTVSGKLLDSTGKPVTTKPGGDIYVADPPLGPLRARSNVDGTYTLPLAPGTYKLGAALPKAAQGVSQGPQAQLVTVTVTAGQTTNQDVTLLAAPNPALWGTVNGTLKDPSGTAIKAAVPISITSASGATTTAAITSSTGTFTISTLAPGTYTLGAGPLISATPVTQQVTIAGGDTQTAALVVAPLGLGGLKVTPRVALTSDAAPAHLQVTLTSVADPTFTQTSETVAGGVATFTNLPVGAYTLSMDPGAALVAPTSIQTTVLKGITTSVDLPITLPAFDEDATAAPVDLTGTALPAGWKEADIDTTGGSSSVANGTLTIKGDGEFLLEQNQNDRMHFNYLEEPVDQSPDLYTIVQVQTVPQANAGAASGLEIRNSTDPLAATAAVFATMGATVNYRYRPMNGSNLDVNSADSAMSVTKQSPPIWLKLRKIGARVAAYYSNDGKTSHLLGQYNILFGAPALVGPFATAHSAGKVDAGTFTGLKIAQPNNTVPPVPFTWGDADGSGKVDLQDVVLGLKVMLGLAVPDTTNTQALKVSGGAVVQVRDLYLMLEKIAAKITKFPVEM